MGRFDWIPWVSPPQPTRSLEERRKLPQRDLGGASAASEFCTFWQSFYGIWRRYSRWAARTRRPVWLAELIANNLAQIRKPDLVIALANRPWLRA